MGGSNGAAGLRGDREHYGKQMEHCLDGSGLACGYDRYILSIKKYKYTTSMYVEDEIRHAFNQIHDVHLT